MLDVHRLRIFRAVVAAGSINGAAAALGYTPSAISQHLTALQRETGLTLVEKHGRGIETTAAGRTLAEEAAHVLERLAELESLVADLRSGRVGSLSVSYFASAGAAWIPPVIAAITHEFPRLRVDLRLVELAHDSSGDPDVEIYVEGAASTSLRGYEVEELLSEPYVVVLPEDHLLAGRDHVELAALRDERWVDNDVSRGPCRQSILDACSVVGFSPGFHIETHDYPTAISFVAAGVGITVLPRLGVGILPPGLVSRPLINPTPMRTIAVRTREAVRDNPAVRRIIDLLRERVDVRQAA
ncbi:MAG: LysR family transcriptional regulator [Gordonia sp.]|nr:LysR family transcriptional regulator [Gordonia sp. (in: high G+C Gram-positive bacteria)]